MERVGFVLVWVLVACASPSASPPVSNPPRDWTQRPDFLELRESYGARDDYASLCEEAQPRIDLFQAANAGAWDEVLEIAGPRLAACPVDIDAHYLSAIALSERDREAAASHHVAWYKGLIESILASGDGGSADSPYVVISVGEEYSILRAFRLDLRNQQLVGGGVDAMATRNEAGEEHTLYFLPRAHWERLRREIGE